MKLILFVDPKVLNLFLNRQTCVGFRGYVLRAFDYEVQVELDYTLFDFEHFVESSLEKIARGDKTIERDYYTVTKTKNRDKTA